ncbi:MAG: hypothetical protein ACYTF2_10705 [Planctomycetota bacterium]
MSGRRLMAVVIASAVLVVCARPTKGPGFEVLSTSQATEPLAAEALYSPVGGAWVYLVTEGAGAGGQFVHSREGTDRYGAAWVDHQADERSEYWRTDETGNLVMPTVVDHANNAITLFRPPLIVAYGQLEPGRTYEQQASMRVMDAKRPMRQRYEGTGIQTIEYLQDQVLRTPLGEFSTKRVDIRFNADLGTARAETTTTLWIIPEIGPLVVQRRRVERLWGLPVRAREQTLVLTSSPVPLPEPQP